MRSLLAVPLLLLLSLSSCRNARVNEHKNWQQLFSKHGIKDGCFMLRDQTHETVHFYNKDRCLQRFSPASTFKIFNAMVALEKAVARDDQMVIRWDSSRHTRPACDKDLTMYEAFRNSCVPWFQELARRNTRPVLQHFLDTVQYGNRQMGNAVDSFWLDNSLQISADEQLGFIKKLYFEELPLTARSQRIVRNMMLQTDEPAHKLYYKTGWATLPNGHSLLWVVGFEEIIETVKEMKGSMNKTNFRTYPYVFALNFEVDNDDTHWSEERITLLKELLADYHSTGR